jgi:hypothetical protein
VLRRLYRSAARRWCPPKTAQEVIHQPCFASAKQGIGGATDVGGTQTIKGVIMYRRITYKERTFFENHETIGFCHGGSLTLVENNAESLERKCYADEGWASEADIFPIKADMLNNTDQRTETFWRQDRAGDYHGITYFIHDGCYDVTVVHWTTAK